MKLKMSRKKCLMISIAALLAGQSIAQAEEAKPTAGVDLGAFSQYIWRGMELSKDSVVLQPSMTIGYQGVSFNIWGNLDTDNDAYDEAKYNETDLTLSYAYTLGMAKLTGGYIYYGLDGVSDSQEVFGSVTLNTFLNPTVTVYREIAHLPSWYVNIGVSHSQPIAGKITLDAAASAGYYHSEDDGFTEVRDPQERYRQFHNGLVSVGMTFPFGDYFAVKPLVAYSFPLTDKAEEHIESTSLSGDSDFIYGGVTLSMAF